MNGVDYLLCLFGVTIKVLLLQEIVSSTVHQTLYKYIGADAYNILAAMLVWHSSIYKKLIALSNKIISERCCYGSGPACE